MIEQLKSGTGTILGFKMSGKLHDQDYQQFVPAVEAAIKTHGKVRLLAQFHQGPGIESLQERQRAMVFVFQQLTPNIQDMDLL